MAAIKRLQNEYKQAKVDPNYWYSVEILNNNIFEWKFIIIGPPETLYESGTFEGLISFPNDYPNRPPKVKFTEEILHPNIYTDGNVCISILHPPGDDKWGYEKAEERWRPVHSVNSIIISIISLLSSPNDESPANIDAGKIWRENKLEFQKKVNMCVRKTLI